MGIGGSIALIVIGLILAFAVKFTIVGIDIQLVGLILTGAGILGLILFFTVWSPRRRISTTRTVAGADPNDPRVYAERPPGYVEERRSYDDGPAV